jgi:hypothetical protein
MGNPTVGSKVMAISNRYTGPEHKNLHLIEYLFHMFSKKYSVRKLP